MADSEAEVVEKQKSTRTCKNCKSNLAGSATSCQNCGSKDIRKTRYIVRKETSDEVPSAEEEVPDYDEMEKTQQESKPPESANSLVPSENEDDEEDEDYDEEEDDEDEEDGVTKVLRVVKTANQGTINDIGFEAAAIALDLAEKVVKSLGSDTSTEDFEKAMNDANNAFDVAVLDWREGEMVEKNADKLAMLKEKKKLLQRKLALLTGAAPEDDDEMSKRDDTQDIFKGLHPEIEKRLKAADELVEKSAVSTWENVAKSFDNVPADYVKLGAALRSIHESAPEAYEVIKSVLDGANANLESSEVFKSIGSPRVQTGNETDDMTALAKTWHEQGKYDTVEQAMVAVMNANPGKFYQPTNR